MKTHSLTSLLGRTAVAGALMLVPLAASAQTSATTTSSVRINRDGFAHVINAEVTSVTDNLIGAVTKFKDTVVRWAFSTNASTTVNVANATPASNDIQIGDHIDVMGTVTTLGSSLGLNATAIKSSGTSFKDMSVFAPAVAGTITSINPGNGTFVMTTLSGKTVTVATQASTTFRIANGTTSASLANLAANARVAVVGIANADGTVITATQVLAKLDDWKDRMSKNGASHGLKNGWKDKEDRDNRGEHKGFLKAFLGFHKADDDNDNDE